MPLHHRTIGSSRSRTLALPCSQPHGCHLAQSHISQPTHFPSSPYSLPITPSALSIPLSFPHPQSPILATISSTTCVLKRFLLTSPRKFALTCVERPVLRTSGWTSLVGGCDEAVMVMKHCLFFYLRLVFLVIKTLAWYKIFSNFGKYFREVSFVG